MAAQAQQPPLTTSPHSPTTTTTTSEPVEHLYHAISSYPFDSDPSYQSGLASILGHPGTPATPQEVTEKPQLVLRAKCFYYARKFNAPPVEVQKYAAWLKSQQQGTVESNTSIQHRQESESTTSIPKTQLNATTADQTAPTTTQSNTTSTQTATDQPPPPPYPTSFAEIIDLITNNKPIPGIQEIPTTVLEPGSSKRDKVTRRRKPWEKDSDDVDDGDETKSTDVGGTTASISTQTDGVKIEQDGIRAPPGRPSKGGGVAHILQPEAIPERTLVSDD